MYAALKGRRQNVVSILLDLMGEVLAPEDVAGDDVKETRSLKVSDVNLALKVYPRLATAFLERSLQLFESVKFVQGKVDRLDLTEGSCLVAGSAEQFPTAFWSKEMKRRADWRGARDKSDQGIIKLGDFVYYNMKDKREFLEQQGADFEEVPEKIGDENKHWKEHWRVVAPRPVCTKLGATTQSGSGRLVSISVNALNEGSVETYDDKHIVSDLCGTRMADIKRQSDMGMKVRACESQRTRPRNYCSETASCEAVSSNSSRHSS